MPFDPDAFLAQTLSQPTSTGFDPDKFLAETDKPSELMSAYRGAANNVPLVPQAIAAGTSLLSGGDRPYSENLEDWNKKAAEAKEANPKSYLAGATAGTIAPLAVPGVGAALEKAPIVGNAIYGAASALSNKDLTKNPVENIKDAALGAAIGGGTAGVMGKILPGSKAFTKLANEEAVKATDVGAGTLERLTPEEHQELGSFIRGLKLVDSDKNTALKKAVEAKQTIGDTIRRIGSKTEEAGLTISPQEHYDAVKSLLDQASKHEGMMNREAKALARSYKAGANDIFNLENPTWNNIQPLKDQYGKYAFGPNGEVKDEAAKDVYFKLRDMLKNITDKAQDNPNLSQEYKDALMGYHRIDPVVRGLQKQVGAERAGGMGHGGGHGLTKIIRSLPGQNKPMINIPTAVATGLLLHPAAGMAVALPTAMNHAVRSNLAAGIANTSPLTNQAINQAVIKYLTDTFR